MCHRKTPTSRCHGDFWSKNVILVWACDDTILKKKWVRFFCPRLLKCAGLDQPTVDSGGVTRGRSVAVAVGCLHFNGTSTALQLHFHGTSTALPQHFHCTSTTHLKKYIVSLLLSASVEGFSFSGIQDFTYCEIYNKVAYFLTYQTLHLLRHG